LFFTIDKTLIKLDYHIDDALHHLEALKETTTIPICFNDSHNQEWSGLRVSHWNEVLPLVRGLHENII
jgi:5'(3')-deoxyribonucleotidase